DGAAATEKLENAFGRSLHIRFVDAGACGACMSEARQLDNPYYNMHRLGFFMTPTPRNADVLLVAGPVADAMRLPLRKTYEAMPPPKRVVAIGLARFSAAFSGPALRFRGEWQISFRSTSWFLAVRPHLWRSSTLSSSRSKENRRPSSFPPHPGNPWRAHDDGRPALHGVFHPV